MKRRSFLKNSVAASAIPFMLGGFNVQALGRNSILQSLMGGCEDRVLVLVQLNGGNDGLNTLIPLDQYTNLTSARPNVIIPQNQVIQLNTDVGFHPTMTGMKSLYDEDKMGILHSVGYPDPNFSHFRSTDIWTTASAADEIWSTGWLGRYLDGLYPGYPDGYPNATDPDPLAITLGSIVSQTCQGPAVNMSMAITSIDAFDQLLSGAVTPAPNTPYGHELTFIRQSIQQTNQYLTSIQGASQNAINLSTLYPAGNRLAEQLKIVARLVAGGLQTQFYVVNAGGFDTHSNQVVAGDPASGTHANLLQTVSDALLGFQDDLNLLGIEDRVVGMTFSEFGRRIADNGSLGTDHGAAAPLFAFGTNINPIIHGQNPIIPQNAGPNDNLPMQYDFRSVYGSILMDWFCVDEQAVKDLLFEDFQHIPVIDPSAVTGVDGGLEKKTISLGQNFPNPVEASTRIPFTTEGGHVKVNVFDSQGRSLFTLTDQVFGPGEHELYFEPRDLTAGIYYYRLQQGSQQEMKMMLVK